MRVQPKFRRIDRLNEAHPDELIEIFAKATNGFVIKRYLVKFRRQGNTLYVDFYNKNGDAIRESWGWGTKRYNIDTRNIPNALDSDKFKAHGCMHYLKKEEAYGDAIKLLKDRKQNINKAIVDLQYALNAVENEQSI